MTKTARPGTVIFSGDKERLARFYEAVTGLTVRANDGDVTVLASDEFELVVHALPGEPTVDGSQSWREAYVKPFFPVTSLAEARKRALDHGGRVSPASEEWEARGFRACEAIDPDGNPIQFRATADGAGHTTYAGAGGGTVETHVTKPGISGIAPLFIVKDVPAALLFYRERLGFEITFQGPEPDDIFFGIVERGAAMIMVKDVGVDPVPNCTRDVKKGIARWDAYLHVPDPDALAAEYAARGVEFFAPLTDTDDGLRGFEVKDADGYVLFFGRPRS